MKQIMGHGWGHYDLDQGTKGILLIETTATQEDLHVYFTSSLMPATLSFHLTERERERGGGGRGKEKEATQEGCVSRLGLR